MAVNWGFVGASAIAGQYLVGAVMAQAGSGSAECAASGDDGMESLLISKTVSRAALTGQRQTVNDGETV